MARLAQEVKRAAEQEGQHAQERLAAAMRVSTALRARQLPPHSTRPINLSITTRLRVYDILDDYTLEPRHLKMSRCLAGDRDLACAGRH